MLFLNDTFTGEADNTNLVAHTGEVGASWTDWIAAPTAAKISAAGRLWPNASGYCTASGVPSSPDYSVFAEVEYLGGGLTGPSVGIAARMDTNATISNYVVRFVASAAQLILYRVDAGAGTQLGSVADITIPTLGGGFKVLELRVSGSSISVWWDGVQVISVTDANITRIGRAGVRTVGTGSATTGLQISRVYAIDTTPSDTITGTDQPSRKVYQRTGSTAAVTLAGTYTGTPAKVQVRVEAFADAATVLDWTDATFGAGTFTLAATLPQGGWYRLLARTVDGSNATLATWSGSNRFGVGLILAIAGQSNAIGYGDADYTTPADTVSICTAGTWGLATEPIVSGRRANSGVPCANALATALGIPVGLVCPDQLAALVGVDGTVWGFRGTTHTDPATKYGVLLTAINQAGGKIEAIIWSQGASDAINGQSTAAYLAAMDTLRTWLDEDTGRTVKWITSTVGRTVLAGSWDAGYNAVRAAHQTWDDGTNRLNAADTIDYPIINGDLVGGYTSHYGGASMRRRGRQEARALLSTLGLATSYGAPRITAAQFTTAARTAIRITISHRGGTTLTPATAIPGFTVADTVGPMTIASAVRETGTTLLITLAVAAVGATTLGYLLGQNPAGPTGLLTDDQADPVAVRALPIPITVAAAAPIYTAPTLRGIAARDRESHLASPMGLAEDIVYIPSTGAEIPARGIWTGLRPSDALMRNGIGAQASWNQSILVIALSLAPTLTRADRFRRVATGETWDIEQTELLTGVGWRVHLSLATEETVGSVR
jgi:hypothetical protein